MQQQKFDCWKPTYRYQNKPNKYIANCIDPLKQNLRKDWKSNFT